MTQGHCLTGSTTTSYGDLEIRVDVLIDVHTQRDEEDDGGPGDLVLSVEHLPRAVHGDALRETGHLDQVRPLCEVFLELLHDLVEVALGLSLIHI